MENILKQQGMAGVQKKEREFDSRKIVARREYYVSHAIYNYKKDPVYGDIFDLGDDYELFIQDKKQFTSIQDYKKGPEEIRIFDDAKSKNLQGFSILDGKHISVFYFNQDCSVSESTAILEGARCYIKKSDCADMTPMTSAKLQKKCSYFNDYSDKTQAQFSKVCDVMSAGATSSSTGGSAGSAAGRKDKSPAVR